MRVQPLLRAIDAQGTVISEATYPPCRVDTIPLMIRAMEDRLRSAGRPVMRVLVDLAITSEPPQEPILGGIYRGLFPSH